VLVADTVKSLALRELSARIHGPVRKQAAMASERLEQRLRDIQARPVVPPEPRRLTGMEIFILTMIATVTIALLGVGWLASRPWPLNTELAASPHGIARTR
jgi:hypothetical protein